MPTVGPLRSWLIRLLGGHVTCPSLADVQPLNTSASSTYSTQVWGSRLAKNLTDMIEGATGISRVGGDAAWREHRSEVHEGAIASLKAAYVAGWLVGVDTARNLDDAGTVGGIGWLLIAASGGPSTPFDTASRNVEAKVIPPSA